MSQRRRISFLETSISTFIGYGVAILSQIIVFPWFGINISISSNLGIGLVFTGISLIRGYCVRRLFNWLWHKGVK